MTAKTAPKVTLWEFFQQLGKTFMLPVALLSFCGIMLGIGSSLSSHDVITLIPVLGNPVLQAIFTWMSKIGSLLLVSCLSCSVSPSRWAWHAKIKA
ncbi:putative bifunctional maltose and glucose-specific PTS system protein, components IICB [Escherichia coli BCE011_MS-01]|nr:putative bifunctional maltose and glucose-specific PTS system protein, components IICB [Escherichia coli BCE011_MS-01]